MHSGCSKYPTRFCRPWEADRIQPIDFPVVVIGRLPSAAFCRQVGRVQNRIAGVFPGVPRASKVGQILPRNNKRCSQAIAIARLLNTTAKTDTSAKECPYGNYPPEMPFCDKIWNPHFRRLGRLSALLNLINEPGAPNSTDS